MYKPKRFGLTIDPKEVLEAFNEANEEIVQHCNIIAELQAINADMLRRISLLEEERFKCNFN